MKKRMAKLLSLALIGTMVFSLAACGGNKSGGGAADGSAAAEGGAAESDIEIGIVVKTSENAHFQDIAYGAVLAGKELGVKVTVDYTAAESEVDEQNEKCETMVARGVDALILTANDSAGMTAAVEAAHDKNIPFVTVDTTIDNVWGDQVDEYLPNYIGVVHEDMAYRLAKNVFDKIDGKGKVIILRGVDAASSSQERTAGFKKAIAEYPDIELVDEQSANYSQDEANQTMGNLIQTHRDVNAILCCNDLMAVGAVDALEDNNVKVGGDDGVLIAGIDGNLLALQSIEDGKMYASAYDWSILQGYYAVQQAYDLIQGKEVPKETWTPDTIITGENVADFLQHGEEVDEWDMNSSEIETVSDYMNEFVKMGQDLEAGATE